MSGATGTGQQPAFPVVINNPPGLSAISYRVGDYTSFREALLQNLPGEVELKGWRPSADGDLGLQLLEWWAYLADITTFYNERIANQSYLGTAVLPVIPAPQPSAPTSSAPAPTSGGTPGLPSPAALIAQVVGFRPTPGIAATGQLAVLVNGKTAISLPPGFAVQSKPGPGQQPQVFEAVPSAATYQPTDSGGAVPVDLSCNTTFTTTGVTTAGTPPILPNPPPGPLLQGTITSIKPGDIVVVAQIPPPAYLSTSSFAVAVKTVSFEKDPRGRTNTRLAFNTPITLPASFASTSPDVTACQVLRGIQSAPPYSFDSALGTAPVIAGLVPTDPPSGGIHLASLVRDIAVGDLVVLELLDTTGTTYQTAAVQNYQETIWYANAQAPATAPQVAPSSIDPTIISIPIPHSIITVESAVLNAIIQNGQTVTRVCYGYRPVSMLLDEMPTSTIPATSAITNYIITPAGVVNTTVAPNATVLLEGADGIGAVGTLTQAPTATLIKLTSASTKLTLPLRLLFNIFDVTTGKTVTNEVLGNGDATVPSQSFTLQKSPLTYLAGANAGFPTSTLQIRVDNVGWLEVPNFQGQLASAQVYVTSEDKNQVTTVTFGDGINGARLTSGTGNITATYRYGSGPGDPSLGGPSVGTVVTVLTPYPGLGSVRNPVPMTGGAAASTPAQVQQSAPSAALTFGRAVAPNDYEAIAAQAPLVARARARTFWNPASHRAAVTVFVDGGPDAVAATQAALATATDPNRPVVVASATEVDLQLAFTVTYDPGVGSSAVQNGVITALTDPATGLFAPSVSGIGDPLYDSQIYAACKAVSGVLAVRSLTVTDVTDPANPAVLPGAVHSPGTGGYFALAPGAVLVTLEAGNG